MSTSSVGPPRGENYSAVVVQPAAEFSYGCLHQIFSLRAREAPQSIGVSAGGKEVTYGELETLANRLARRLRQRGVGPEVRVGLCLDPGIDLIVGMLGILKAGGAYVPIDPDYPPHRIRFLLRDSAVSTIVSATRLSSSLQDCPTSILWIDREEDQGPSARQAIKIEVKDDNLAYVIYTSGSTGAPKGVMVEHRNVVRLFEQTRRWFGFNSGDVWTQLHSSSFDFSVWEIWGALLHGGRLVIVPLSVRRSPWDLHSFLRSTGVTILNQTPSAFRQLLAADLRNGGPSRFHLRQIIFGGERLDPDLLEPWIVRYGDQKPALVNMYGITETTVHVTYRRILRSDLKLTHVSPIGVPLPDLQIHLLDQSGEPVADGMPGEIHVSGPGLARGYLNQPRLTAERFLKRRAGSDRQRVRLYRSGDRAVRLPDGELAYLGRADDQINIRGFRVEPYEIESFLRRQRQVAAGVVVPVDYGEGDVRLVAYVVPSSRARMQGRQAEELRASLTARAKGELPVHMRPSLYLVVSEIPMTPHGKEDREALRELALQGFSEDQTSAPDAKLLTETQKVVRDVCREVLKSGSIGLKDDLFDLGATSLAFTRILLRVNQRLQVVLTGSELKEATVAALADAADACPVSSALGERED